MITHPVICPYTGLRSFTEEESLYFKGRDLQVDQITALLEQNKFLMVTGASGEGKSSLIYAGLIPNAKAGFFKSKYTNWVIADFRPERSPIHNMAKALASTFSSSPATIETELRRGYSSLIDLYTNSEYYIDESDAEWKKLEEPGKKQRKRKAANLMIIVDQFEEFFTNPENFYKEAPSQDSQIVVNLVLETARIAIKRNIPVYVVCTMRSDYIGQCSAFRGLPEYIGFSQFFVPRLKRKDLKQVIEEPAILSGNRISQRLIERLVYDIADGVDQLPILQHALNQIWLVADQGRQEMDLIHYAKVGGMPANELPDEEQPAFRTWFETLPPTRQKYYNDTGLSKVIEIHASALYENAWESFNTKHPDTPISQQDAKRIIALTFSCLTKIDNSRAVRNRMSLDEITGIINSQAFTPGVVGEVLSIYREEGNSFIRPFKTEDPSTHNISGTTVLDITHESLIRNWNKLNTWANQEFEYYTTFLDFKKQLDRWKASGKSRGFLLPIGPLTYFENWYNKCKPNVGWINRYSEIQEDPVKANQHAQDTLSDVRSFIKRSANKVAVTRAFMKYGAGRIATVLAIVAMTVLIAFYWYDAEQKQNKRVIKRVRSETATLFKSKELNDEFKAIALLIEDRYEPGFLLSYLRGLDNKEKISKANPVYKQGLEFDKYDSASLKNELAELIYSTIQNYPTVNEKDYRFLLPELNKYSSYLAYDQYYNPTEQKAKMLADIVDKEYRLALVFYGTPTLYETKMPYELNYGIQLWLTFGHVSVPQLDSLLKLISPFEDDEAKKHFDAYYPKGKVESNGSGNNEFNGGYQTLASLYAAKGDVDKMLQCLETLKQANQNDYFTANVWNNHANILAVLYQYGYREKASQLVNWLASNYPVNTPEAIYKNAILRGGYINRWYQANVRGFGSFFFPNLCLADRSIFNALVEDYEKLVKGINDPSERNFLMAINMKRRAMLTHKYQLDRQIKPTTDSLEQLLQQAVDHYRLVGKDYLEAKVTITIPYNLDGVRTPSYSRRQLFIYPDYMDGWFAGSYHSDLFFNFIDKNKLFEELYKNSEDLEMIHTWVAKAYGRKLFFGLASFDNDYPLSDTVLSRVVSLTTTHIKGKELDQNLINLMLANRAFARGDTNAGIKCYQRFEKNNFIGSSEKHEYLEKTWFLNQVKDVAANLAVAGRHSEAVGLAEKFEKDWEKAYAYIDMAEKIYLDRKDPMAFVYLDSVFSKSKYIDFSQYAFTQSEDFRFNLILLLSRIGGRDMNALSNNFLSEIIQTSRFVAVIGKVYGVAETGNFYLAKTSTPSTLTETEDLIAKSVILWQASRKQEKEAGHPKWTGMDEFITSNFDYVGYRTF